MKPGVIGTEKMVEDALFATQLDADEKENRKLLLPFSLLIRRNQRVFSIVFLYRIPYTQHRIIKL